MSDSKELSATVRAVSCLDGAFLRNDLRDDGYLDVVVDGIVELAAHAGPLVELVAACERLSDNANANTMKDVYDALAKVHAVGKEGA